MSRCERAEIFNGNSKLIQYVMGTDGFMSYVGEENNLGHNKIACVELKKKLLFLECI